MSKSFSYDNHPAWKKVAEAMAQLQAAQGELRQAELNARHDAASKSTYIIWKSVEDRNVSDVNDVVGLFVGTYEEADALIERLNKADPSVREGFGGRVRYGYWRSEPTFITAANEKEFTQDL